MTPKPVNPNDSVPLLDAIRHVEAEVKRRLAAERLAAQLTITQTEQHAHELVAAAEADGQREGEAQRRQAQHDAERLGEALVASARLEAERLHRLGEAQLNTAITRAIEIVLGGTRAT